MQTNIKFHLLPHKWQDSPSWSLNDEYERAFKTAKEICIVSAFLTEWPKDLVLNEKCARFRFVVGTDFGTTRHSAVEAAYRWLPKRFKGGILAYNQNSGTFHPKAVLWRDHSGDSFLLIGSSNLTRAAFGSNVEANVTLSLSQAEYETAMDWIAKIEDRSVEVNSAWLNKYVEAHIPPRPPNTTKKKKKTTADITKPVFDLELMIEGKSATDLFQSNLEIRRAQRKSFDRNSKGPLIKLFRDSAAKVHWSNDDNVQFYESLSRYWGANSETRMGGGQWVIKGKGGDHQQLAKSLVTIFDAPSNERDAVVIAEKNRLQETAVPTRGAVLTELLCHFYPTRYPILDQPVRDWRSRVGFDQGVGGSEGERYLRLALTMRAALNDTGPVQLGIRNLAELDTLIWVQSQTN